MEFDLLSPHLSEIRAAESHKYGKPHKPLDLRGFATKFHSLRVQGLGLGLALSVGVKVSTIPEHLEFEQQRPSP